LVALGAIAFGTTLTLAAPTAVAVGSADPAPAIKVSQTSADTTSGGGVSCASNATNEIKESHYLRRYDLTGYAAAGMTTESVSFGVGTAMSTGGNIPGSVVVSSIPHGSPFTYANMTMLATATVNLDSVADGAVLTAPVVATVPAGADMVLEVKANDATSSDQKFYPGITSGTETAPSYLSAPGCGAANPVTMASIGFATNRWVLYATGKTTECKNAETAYDTAKAAVTTAQAEVTKATAAQAAAAAAIAKPTADVAKATSKVKKAKAKVKKAKQSGNASKVKKAKAKLKKAKAALKTAKAALATAQANLSAADTALASAKSKLTTAQAAQTTAQTTATSKCAQPTLPVARPGSAPAGASPAGVHGLSAAK
jgi:hypothetical protein